MNVIKADFKKISLNTTLTERAMIERMAERFDRSFTYIIREAIREKYQRMKGRAK